MKKIAIYGKGGIGKSTTVSNLSAALSMEGFRVMQIGCDPKADSTRNLTGGKSIPTVLDVLRGKKDSIVLEDLVHPGFNGIFCVEAGGPTPGIGCAGRGIIAAFEKLEELKAYEICKPDIVLYDVLGDVVCGGFAMPMREGYADEVLIVSSGEMMALYAAYNIAQAVKNFAGRSYATLTGIILNRRNIENERALVEKAAGEIGTDIIGEIPRCSLVQDAEAQGKTVLELFPESEMSGTYRSLGILLAGETLQAAAS
ncbi:nitrogenase iron protein [Treponema primitia ZAS-2]|uniref:Nitrogenase iron protein n=1 Tax=Treponema primitia (strain ATCC BAA-887 / DSM 12427 / ZAS-2) TaxID=545694 RepID=F5YID2_TREPZ|nr:nitrogenase iron protein NifH [Treponema primitia]AEF84422.1 nitrogenase iron protein [Treponema primitia ZAS-2]